MNFPRSPRWRYALLTAAAMATVGALIAFLFGLTGGREFTDDLPLMHFLADHPFVLIGHNKGLLESNSLLFGGVYTYPPLQPMLIALVLAPFRFLPDFWSHRIATALVILACIYQGRAVLSVRTGPKTAARRLILGGLFVQLVCAGAVWAQVDDAIAAFAVLTIARFRPKTPAGAVVASGVMFFCSKSLLLPAIASLIVMEFHSADGWKKPSTAIALASCVTVLVLNRLTLRLLSEDPLVVFGSIDPTFGVGLTTLLWNLGLHAGVMRNSLLHFPVAILLGVVLAGWRSARSPALGDSLFQSAIRAAPVAGRWGLVLSQLLFGVSQPEYFLWMTAGWMLLSYETADALEFRQLAMLLMAGVAAWGTNILYGLIHARGAAKRRLLEMALQFTSESGLHVMWYLCLISTTVLLIGVIASDFWAREQGPRLGYTGTSPSGTPFPVQGSPGL